MLLEYIVFITLLLAGILAYVLHKPSKDNIEIDYCESYIERRLYKALQYRGYYVRTQVRCGKYRIDIALPAYRLAIECDGKAYHSSPEQKAHDRRKNAYLRRNGWRVLRFSGRQINGELSKVLARIEKALIE
nr:DUF559 domain-containing protein [Paenibacillus bovis]